MAKILLTWELGGGLGHLVNLKPFADGLARRGHQVFAAFKDLTRVGDVFATENVTYLQAPILSRRLDEHVLRPFTFAHILHNCGFGDLDTLRRLTQGWKDLFDRRRPDLVVLDHSPVALFAARVLGVPRCHVGTGFFTPRPVWPLPAFRRNWPSTPEELVLGEQRVLSHMNALLAVWGQPPLARVSDLYAEVEKNFLATFPELDHYGRREDGRYVGAWPMGIGLAPDWPPVPGPRIYAYLKPGLGVGPVLDALSGVSASALVYVPGLRGEAIARHQSSRLRILDAPLELRQVGRECDLAILNGNHGTTVAMLLSGKPTLHVPIHLEQALFVRAVERLGAGVRLDPARPETIGPALGAAIDGDGLRGGAVKFAQRYAGYDPDAAIESMLAETEALLPRPPAATGDVRVDRAPAYCDPRHLLHHKRFDVMAKVLYAQHRHWGLQCDWARRVYLTHLKFLNELFEACPRKRGAREFVEAFNALLDSIRQRGHESGASAVSVGVDGALLNGAHRLAACLLYDTPIWCERRDYPGFDYSAAWFRRRTNQGPSGLPSACGDAMALEYSRLQSSCRVLVVASASVITESAVLDPLREHCRVAYARKLAPGPSAVARLWRLARDRAWTTSINGLPDAPEDALRAATTLRVFLVEFASAEHAAGLIRDLGRLESEGTHVLLTDGGATAAEAAECLLNPNGPLWLQACLDLPGASLRARLDDLAAELRERGIPRACACLGGPAVDEAHGHGTSERPRLVVASAFERAAGELSTATLVRFPAGTPGFGDVPIADPRLHFHYAGFKFLTPRVNRVALASAVT